MQIPSMLQGSSLARLVQGAALGATLAVLIGFNWGGWMLESSATKRSASFANDAVIAALTPICVENFQGSDDVLANLENFRKESSYKQASFIEDGGWAIFPGDGKLDRNVAIACADAISELN